MPFVTYTAIDRGTLLPGHTAGLQYSIEFIASQAQLTPKRVNNGHTAMSGDSETLRFRKERTWDIQTGLVKHADLPIWYEFLDSVDACEPFTLDPYGSLASPDTPLTVKLEGDPREPRNGSSRIYNIQFKAKES